MARWPHSASAAAPDAGEATVSSPDSLPLEILQAAAQGDMQKVLEWLGRGGSVDAVYSYSVPTHNARKGTSWPFMPTPEEVGKEIDLSGADLSYGDFALDLDLDEDNEDEDTDEDEDGFTHDRLPRTTSPYCHGSGRPECRPERRASETT
eukprot:scaffold39641_cov63-Phaeocystis_antarctica.AAC.1